MTESTDDDDVRVLIRLADAEDVKKWQCIACLLRFDGLAKAREHTRNQHTAVIGALIACPVLGCDGRFDRFQKLAAHFQAAHERYACRDRDCGAMFTTMDGRKRHEGRQHGKNRYRYPCFDCDKRFVSGQDRLAHLMHRHKYSARSLGSKTGAGECRQGCKCFFKRPFLRLRHEATCTGRKRKAAADPPVEVDDAADSEKIGTMQHIGERIVGRVLLK